VILLIIIPQSGGKLNSLHLVGSISVLGRDVRE
jgi:hypothetical protein